MSKAGRQTLSRPKPEVTKVAGGAFGRVARRAGGPFALLAVGIGMLASGWGAWPDVLIDFGRELYVPWQLLEGKLLYRDIAYLNGPLSPYLNALWFRLFGVGLSTLVLANLAILGLTVVLVYRMLVQVSTRLAATVACATFLAVFAFGQLIWVGNYNFVCPYSHELTHGLLLCAAGLTSFLRFLRTGRLRLVADMGLTVGLTFLTKPEVFLAGAATMTVGLALSMLVERPPWQRAACRVATFIMAALVPPALTYFALQAAMPSDAALRGTLSSCAYLFNADLTALPFYKQGMGLLGPGGSVLTMLKWSALYLVALMPLIAMALLRGVPERSRRPLCLIASLAIGALLLWQSDDIDWPRIAMPWPIFMAAIGIVALVYLPRHHDDRDASRRLVTIITLSTFALALLAKMVLNVRIHHYGFVLAAPAAMLVIVTLVAWVPEWISQRGGCAWLFRGPVLAVLLVSVAAHVQRSDQWFETKSHAVGTGADRFSADARGDAVNTMLTELDKRARAGATLAVLPEGVMLNYLARRTNPTPYTTFMPPEMIVFGEATMLAAFQADPPDFVILVHKDTSEYGPRFFGRDYGEDLFNWIRENYRPASQVGAVPLQTDGFGLLLLEAAGARCNTP